MKNSLLPLKPYDKFFNPTVPFQANSQYREEYSPKASNPPEPIVNKSTYFFLNLVYKT